jgi:hypothetical protein
VSSLVGFEPLPEISSSSFTSSPAFALTALKKNTSSLLLLQLLLFLPPIKTSSLLLLLPSPNPSRKPRIPRFRKQLPTKHPEVLDLSFQELLPGNSWPLENLEDDNNDDDDHDNVAMEGRCESIAGTQTLFCKTDIVYGQNIRSSPSGARYLTLQ